jgi:hypothetical protein
MNTYNLFLSSNTTGITETMSNIDIFDQTLFTIDITGVSEIVPLKNISINWGDGVESVFSNRLFKNYRTESIFPELTAGKFSSIFNEEINHKYNLSNSIYTLLTCQVLIEFVNNKHNLYIIPITFKTYEFFDAIGELFLVNTNLLPLPGNNVKMTFMTSINNQIIESTSP